MITDALRDAVAEKILNETHPNNSLPFAAHDERLQDSFRVLANNVLGYEFVRASLAQTLWY